MTEKKKDKRRGKRGWLVLEKQRVEVMKEVTQYIEKMEQNKKIIYKKEQNRSKRYYSSFKSARTNR